MVYIALAAAVGLIGLDQLTKYIIDSNMHLHQSIPVIQIGGTNVLNITYERNTGAAFSILEGKQIFLIIITALILLGCCICCCQSELKSPRTFGAWRLYSRAA